MNCQLVHSVKNRLRFGVEPLVNACLEVPFNLRAASLWMAMGALTCMLAACGGGSGDGLDQNGRPLTDSPPIDPSTPTADFKFLQDTVLSPICTVCHAGGAAPLGLRLDTANAFAMLTGVASVQQPQLLRVAPGDPDNSYLIQKLEGTAAVGGQMPLGGPALNAKTIALFKQWVMDGAQPPGLSPPGGLPPTVSFVSPAADSVLAAGPAELSAVFSQTMDESLVSDITFVLQNSGGDGTFGDGNEQTVFPVSVLLTSVQAIRMDLATVNLVDEVYQARLVGTGATALANPGGLILDGDADGVQGGDFVWQFTVNSVVVTPLRTWRWIQDNIFTPQCVVCHVAGGAADFLPLNEQDSYGQLVNVTSTEGGPQFRVLPGDPDNSSLVQRLEGALSPQMPLGGAPLPADQIDAVRQWILDGALAEMLADVSPPVVSLVTPGSIVSGNVTLLATAVDDVGVTSVRIFVDGILLASDTAAPFEATWNTLLTNDGSRVISAEADDAAGNTGLSVDLIVTVDNTIPPDTTAPDVSIQAVNNPISGTVAVDINATDSVGVTSVSLSVDGIETGTDVTLPYQIPLNTLALANGDHLLMATASDAAGNTGTSSPITVTVLNLEPVIFVIIEAPQTVNRGDDFTVVATLSNAGVQSGELTAVLNFTPSDLLRIEEPGAAQFIGVVPTSGTVPVVWLLRGDDEGVATVTVDVTDAFNAVVAQHQITVTVID